MKGNLNMNKSDVQTQPPFKNYQEEAEFWDNHDPLDLMEPGSTPSVSQGHKNTKSVYIGSRLEESLNIRFSQEDINAIRELADKKGIGPTTLIRMWTKEKLQEQSFSQK